MTTLPYHAGPRLALPTPTTARAAPVAGRSPLWAVLGASAWMATVGNLALWRELAALGQLQGLRGLLLGLGLAGIVMALTTALASLLAWHRTLKPALALLLLVTAASLHFMLAYRIVIDPSMLVNVLQTDAHEAADLLSARLLATLALAGGCRCCCCGGCRCTMAARAGRRCATWACCWPAWRWRWRCCWRCSSRWHR
nr:phosphoethanolamine transferase domain-containing protein [Aquincola sp. J276]